MRAQRKCTFFETILDPDLLLGKFILRPESLLSTSSRPQNYWGCDVTHISGTRQGLHSRPRWKSGLPHFQASLLSCSLTAPLGAVFPAGCALLPRNQAACETHQHSGPPPLLSTLGQEERWICIPHTSGVLGKTQLSWKGFFFFFPLSIALQ